MTIDQALAKAAAFIDTQIDLERARFEQSLVDNYSPETDVELLCVWFVERMAGWRAETLAKVRAGLLDSSGWTPSRP